jgi:hypothetical protein
VISGRQLHGQEALTNQFMYYAQSTALSRAVHGVPIPVRCTMSQSPCGARCANPRAVHGVPIPVRLLTKSACQLTQWTGEARRKQNFQDSHRPQ